VIDELESRFENDPDVGIAYIFCSFEHNDDQTQRPDSLLASILRQLVQGMVSVPDDIMALYDKHKVKGTRLSWGEISKCLRSAVRQFSRVFVVIDALDECGTLTLSQLLEELFELQVASKLSLLATSRFIPEIMAMFQQKVTQEIRATKTDVMEYLNANLTILPAFVSRNQQLQQKIKVGIADAVGGM
jgi:hypothetical protein